LAAVALLGWELAKLPPNIARISDLPDGEQAELAWLWTAGPEGMATLWREHEGYLRREAKRLQVPPLYSRNGSRCFWSEYVALGLDTRKDA
jgi:hypothetical protein